MSEIGIVFIARGLDPNHWQRITRFAESYLRHPAGIEHQLYILYKHFVSHDQLMDSRGVFWDVPAIDVLDFIDEPSFAYASDIGSFVTEPIFCPLNGTSEIMHDDWLKKLYEVFKLPGVGLVGCCGSSDNSTLHIRDTAILVDRMRYLEIAAPFDWTTKKGWLNFENGPNNLTQQIMRGGEKVFVVEKDRIRAPEEWPVTTYRGNLENVLVHDRGARDWHDL